jgi:hypothetical protein
MHIEAETILVEDNCGVDEPPTCEDVTTNSSKMKGVHLEPSNLLQNEILLLATIQLQATFWKPHRYVSICWGFCVVNDDLHVDLENLQIF